MGGDRSGCRKLYEPVRDLGGGGNYIRDLGGPATVQKTRPREDLDKGPFDSPGRSLVLVPLLVSGTTRGPIASFPRPCGIDEVYRVQAHNSLKFRR